MNMKLVKRIIAATLAATLMIAPAITAGAATDTGSGAATQTTGGTTTTQTTATVVNPNVSSESTVAVGGVVLKSQVAGAYAVRSLAGVAIRQSAATIKTAAGLAANETPFVRAYDITAKNSPAAFASINAAAASVGGTVIGAINIDLGKLTAGKFSQLSADVAVPTTVGVKNPPAGKTLAVVKVLPGGAFEVLQDADDNAYTVTFNITGGLAAYAVIAY